MDERKCRMSFQISSNSRRPVATHESTSYPRGNSAKLNGEWPSSKVGCATKSPSHLRKRLLAPRGTTMEQSLPSVKRPAEVITDNTDCQTRWRIYDESVACFGPYRTTQGATKPEGFDKCNDIPSPEIKCGPRRN
jgi:hypothetical protein